MKTLHEEDELIDVVYRYCSKCRCYKLVAGIGCWGYRYLCKECWDKMYNKESWDRMYNKGDANEIRTK
jgi:hypothetical protein